MNNSELTDKIRKNLEKHNISEKTYKQRIANGHNPEDASTTPVKHVGLDDEIRKNLKKNKINYTTYWNRVNTGMSPEKASTLPVQRKITFSAEELQVMEENDVSKALAKRRLRYGTWSRKQALTTPPQAKR